MAGCNRCEDFNYQGEEEEEVRQLVLKNCCMKSALLICPFFLILKTEKN